MNTTNAHHAASYITAGAATVAAAAVIAIGSVAISQVANAGPSRCSVPPAPPSITVPFSDGSIAHTGGKAMVGP